jgi:hypothetical protein
MMDRDPRVVIAELAARIDKLENEVKQPEVERLRAALLQILEDPDAKILDSHRDDGWEALSEL